MTTITTEAKFFDYFLVFLYLILTIFIFRICYKVLTQKRKSKCTQNFLSLIFLLGFLFIRLSLNSFIPFKVYIFHVNELFYLNY